MLRFALTSAIFLAIAAGPAFAAPSSAEIRAETDAVVEHAKTMLDDGAPVFVAGCCGQPIQLSEEDLALIRGRKFYIVIPHKQSPFDVHVQVGGRTGETEYRQLQITAKNDSDISLWWTSIRSSALQRYDYYLSLQVGGLDSQASGQLYGSSYLNWQQSNEYRLIALHVPEDSGAPAFHLVLDDEMLVTVAAAPNPNGLIPSVRPTFSIRPASLGISMSGGKNDRYRVSVGAGYALSYLPFAAPNSATQGFLRFRLRLK